VNDRLSKILNLKNIESLLKMVMSWIHLLLGVSPTFRNLFWTQFLSVILMGVLLLDILTIIYILITRLVHLNDPEEHHLAAQAPVTVKEVIGEQMRTESD
jgi:hypothetical protein